MSRLSTIYARVGNHERANALVGTPKDIDVHDYLSVRAREADKEGREFIRGNLQSRAYAPGDINTPRMQGFAVDYSDAFTYIADLVAPVVDVEGDVSRRYTKFSRRDTARIVDTRVSSKGDPKETSIDISSATYLEQGHAEISKVSNKDLRDAANIPRLLMKHQKAVRGDLKRARELRVAQQVMTAANYAAGCSLALAGNNRWDVGAGSTADPLDDIRVKAKAAAAIGAPLNAGACSYPVAEILRKHPKVVAVAGIRASDRVLSFDDLRNILGLQYLFVGDFRYDSTGTAPTPTYGFAWGKGFALLNVQPAATDDDSSFMKSFIHDPMEFIEETDNIPGVRGITILKGSYSVAEIITASDDGFLLDTVIS